METKDKINKMMMTMTLESPKIIVTNNDKNKNNIENIPVELKLKILKYLTPKYILRMSRVSRQWLTLSQDESIWKDKVQRHYHSVGRGYKPGTITKVKIIKVIFVVRFCWFF